MEWMPEDSSVEAGGSDPQWETQELPPIQPAKRRRCRGCGRNDRPVFGGICSWCNEQ